MEKQNSKRYIIALPIKLKNEYSRIVSSSSTFVLKEGPC